MDIIKIEWKKGLLAGVTAGLAWGIIALLVNIASGVFPVEYSITHNVIAFMTAGAVIGALTGGLTAVSVNFLKFRYMVIHTMLLSACLWLLLRAAGFFMSIFSPERFHTDIPQTLQGLTLSIILGICLGFTWNLTFRASTAKSL